MRGPTLYFETERNYSGPTTTHHQSNLSVPKMVLNSFPSAKLLFPFVVKPEGPHGQRSTSHRPLACFHPPSQWIFWKGWHSLPFVTPTLRWQAKQRETCFLRKGQDPFLTPTSHRDLSEMVGWGYINIFEIKDRVGVDKNVGLFS